MRFEKIATFAKNVLDMPSAMLYTKNNHNFPKDHLHLCYEHHCLISDTNLQVFLPQFEEPTIRNKQYSSFQSPKNPLEHVLLVLQDVDITIQHTLYLKISNDDQDKLLTKTCSRI